MSITSSIVATGALMSRYHENPRYYLTEGYIQDP
jgi:hypothetical protein